MASSGAEVDAGTAMLRSLVAATRASARVPATVSGLSEQHADAVRRLARMLAELAEQAGLPGVARAVTPLIGAASLDSNALDESAVEALADGVDSLIERSDMSLDRARGIRNTKSVAVTRGALAGGDSADHGDDGLPSWDSLVEAEAAGAGAALPSGTEPLRAGPGAVLPLSGPLRIGRRHPSANARSRRFRPLLPSKPCALPEAPLAGAPLPDGTWPHPYAAELAALDLSASAAWFLRPSAPGAFRPAAPAAWVDTPEAVEAMVAHLSEARVRLVAVDVEAHTDHSFQGLTCLIQVSSEWSDFLVDTLALSAEQLAPLNAVTADPSVVKLLHGCDRDVVWLQRCCGLYLVGVFDTGQAARRLGLPSAGLAYLLRTMAGVEADKTLQRADWRRRPLPPAMLGYAAEDTRFLVPIALRLRNQLLGLPDGAAALADVLDASRRLCTQAYEIPAFKAGRQSRDMAARAGLRLDDAHGRVLEALCDWRDRVARAADEAPHTIVPKRALLRLAEAAPVTLGGLASACHPLPPAVHGRAAELCRVVALAKKGRSGRAWHRDAQASSSSSQGRVETADVAALASAAPADVAGALRRHTVAGSLVDDAGVLRLPALPAGEAAATRPGSAASSTVMTVADVDAQPPGSAVVPDVSSVLSMAPRPLPTLAGGGAASAASATVRESLGSTPHLIAAGVPLHLLAAASAAVMAQAAAAASAAQRAGDDGAEDEDEEDADAAAERAAALPASVSQKHRSGDARPRAAKHPRPDAEDAEADDGQGSAAKRGRASADREALLADTAMAAASSGGSLSASALVAGVADADRAVTSRNAAFKKSVKAKRDRRGGSDNPFMADPSEAKQRRKRR